MNKINYVRIHSFLTLITVIVLLTSLYLQYFVKLQPCPLCLMQRFCVFLLLIIMGLSFHTLKRAHLLSILQVIISAAGMFFSVRQIWLQTLPPDKAPACMPGLDVLINYFPWQTVAKALFWGAGDCAEVTWSFLGISLPGWGAIYFLFMFLIGICLFFGTKQNTLRS